MTPHPNDDAWVKVPLFGAIGYAVLLVTVAPRAGGDWGSAAAWLLLPTVIAIGAVVMAATSSKRRWGARVYALAAPVAVVLLALGVGLLSQSSSAPADTVATAAPRSVAEVTGAAGPSATPEAPSPSTAPPEPAVPAKLLAPATAEGWTQVETAAGAVADAELGKWTADLYGIDDVVVGSYAPDSDPGAVFRYVGVNGHIVAETPEAAGRAALVSTAGTTVVSYPPEADGWLGCNSASAQGTARVVCAWVSEDRAVFLRWQSAVPMETAAALTRSFRDFATAA